VEQCCTRSDWSRVEERSAVVSIDEIVELVSKKRLLCCDVCRQPAEEGNAAWWLEACLKLEEGRSSSAALHSIVSGHVKDSWRCCYLEEELGFFCQRCPCQLVVWIMAYEESIGLERST
jgi:hypothetical protein